MLVWVIGHPGRAINLHKHCGTYYLYHRHSCFAWIYACALRLVRIFQAKHSCLSYKYYICTLNCAIYRKLVVEWVDAQNILKCYIDVHMKMGMCMCAVRLGGLPIQCPGMAKSLATPLIIHVSYVHLQLQDTFLVTAWFCKIVHLFCVCHFWSCELTYLL